MLYGELIDNVVPTQSKVAEPSTSEVIVKPDKGLYLSKVSVKGVTSNIDPNIKAENIRLGTTILGVEGNLAPDKPDQEKSVVPSKEQQEVVADTGYELAKVVVKATPLEELSVSEDGTYEPSGDNIGFSKIVVSVGDKEIVADLPMELQGFSVGDVKSFVTFAVNERIFIITDSYSKTTWKVNVLTNEWVKLIDNGYNYTFFAKIDNKVIIAHSGGSSAQVYAYNILLDSLEEMVSDTGYNLRTSINSVYDAGNYALIAYTDSGKTIYSYDKSLQRIVSRFTTNNMVDAPLYTFENKTLIRTRNNNGANEFYIFNSTDNTCILAQGNENLGAQLYFRSAKNNIVSLGFSSSSYLGFYWLDLNTAQIYHAENDAVDAIWVDQSIVLDNGVILLGRFFNNGVYALDTNTKTYIAQSTESSLGYVTMKDQKNAIELEDVVLYSRYSGTAGLWQYSKTNNTFSKVFDNGTDWRLLTKLNKVNSAILYRSGYAYLYSYTNGVVTSLFGAGNSETFSVVENNESGAILDLKTTKVRLLYDLESNTAKPMGVIL